MAGRRSVEGSKTVLAEAVTRDGAIHWHGSLLDHRCAKIQRVCESSISAESRATVAEDDQALWIQALLNEITTGRYDIIHIAPPSEFPRPDPSGPPPTNGEVKWKRRAANQKRRIRMTSRNSLIPRYQPAR